MCLLGIVLSILLYVGGVLRLCKLRNKFFISETALKRWYRLLKNNNFSSLKKYEETVALLDSLIDEVGEN